MLYDNQLLKLADYNDGILTASQVREAGIPNEYIRRAEKKGVLIKFERGVYARPDVFEDELFNLHNRYKRGIFSHETAIYLMDLSDRTPLKYTMTFPLNYSTWRISNDSLDVFRVRNEIFELGLVMGKTPQGHNVPHYCAERTLCDMLRPQAHSDPSIVIDAFRRWAESPSKDILLLSEISKTLKVDTKVRSYLEILL